MDVCRIIAQSLIELYRNRQPWFTMIFWLCRDLCNNFKYWVGIVHLVLFLPNLKQLVRDVHFVLMLVYLLTFLVLWFPLRFLLNNDAQFVLPPVVCSRALVLFMLFVLACVTYVLTTPVAWWCLIRSRNCLLLTVPIFLDFCVVFCLPNAASFSGLWHGFFLSIVYLSFIYFHCR